MRVLSRLYIGLILPLFLLAGCDKAPDDVIKESKMAPLLADLAIAEAYIDANPNQFMDDSSRLAMKQSIFLKYNITSKEYEHSLDWYGHNLEVYNAVLEKSIAIIDDNRKKTDTSLGNELENDFASNNSEITGSRKIYPSTGDTANLWIARHTYIITGAQSNGFLPFEIKRLNENFKGDRFNLCFKLNASGNRVNVFMAVDYSDGSTSFVHRGSAIDGWGDYTLQSDSSRHVTRLYGYIGYDMKRSSIAFVDSIQLIRTRLDRNNYDLFNIQRFVGERRAIENKQIPQSIKINENNNPPPRKTPQVAADRHL